MAFIVKATGSGLGVSWLAPATAIAGSHTLGPRKDAMVFRAHAEAQAAVAKLSEALGKLGMVFSVEAAD
jgi:hypothetical protein